MNAGKGNAVQVLGVTHLYTAQVKTHHGRIVANGSQDITLAQFCTVTPIGAFPGDAIERIILVSHHITLLLQGLQPLSQQLGSGLHFLFLIPTGSHQYGYTYYIYIRLHLL